MGLLALGALVAFALVSTARYLATSVSISNRTEQPLRIVPVGMSPEGPVPLPLKPSEPRTLPTISPGGTLVFHYMPGVANFCWLLIVPPQGPMRITDSHAARGDCKPGVTPSSPWGPPAAEYFISSPLEELPLAPPEFVRMGEKRLAEQ
jgi:hypothetical protein